MKTFILIVGYYFTLQSCGTILFGHKTDKRPQLTREEMANFCEEREMFLDSNIAACRLTENFCDCAIDEVFCTELGAKFQDIGTGPECIIFP